MARASARAWALDPDYRQTYPTRVPCRFKRKNGQVVLDQIRTVDRSRLVKKLGRIDSNTATAVLDATGGNLLVARHAGGWASTRIVEDVYGHPDLHDPVLTAALARVWAGGGQ